MYVWFFPILFGMGSADVRHISNVTGSAVLAAHPTLRYVKYHPSLQSFCPWTVGIQVLIHDP